MSSETRDVLLYEMLLDGLRIDLVSKAPAISGVQNYQELCIASKNEERRLAELKGKRQYARSEAPYQPTNAQMPRGEVKKERPKSHKQLRCYICNNPGHFAHQC